MYRKVQFLIVLILIVSISADAQYASRILAKFVQRVNSGKLSYVAVTDNESPFGDNSDTITVYQHLQKGGWQFAGESRQFREVYTDSSLLHMDLPNKYYSVNNDYRFSRVYGNSNPLFKLLEVIKETPVVNIRTMRDTTIGGIACHHIRVSKMDMEKGGTRRTFCNSTP